jgi:hypothetical protein
MTRPLERIGALFSALALVIAAAGCGSSGRSVFGDGGEADAGGGGGEDGGGCDPNVDPFCFATDGGGDGSVTPCENLECQIVNCGTSNGTSISGKVYDPAGKNPLYNVFVYVPNRPLDPIPDNGVVCTACQAPASGKPIASAVTNEKGEFLIKNAPVGTDIPLVMQVGKWRRVIQIPQVKQCVDNALTDPNLTRLPRKHKEGSAFDHIPKIAFSTGCDPAECFLLKRIGIDQSEFTGPSQNGRVHLYAGSGYNWAGVPGAMGSLTTLYNSAAELKKYDIVFSACECSALDRGQGYQNIKDYLESGGRFFGTHYFYNLFSNSTQCAVGSSYATATCKGPAEYNAVASWIGEASGPYTAYLNVDTSHPKGQALMAWLQNVQPTNPGLLLMGNSVQLTDLRANAQGTNAAATRYLYTNTNSYYFSWNVPTMAMPDKQCGRSVFSGVHLSGSASGSWPGRCSNLPLANYQGNELALEYLFFDLSSCVGDDKKPPPIPPPH